MVTHTSTRLDSRRSLMSVLAVATQWFIGKLATIPDGLIVTLGRFSIAAVFWLSGQTKVDGLDIDLVHGTFKVAWPHLSQSALLLFSSEYKLPLLPPTLAALMAATAEHVFSVLILIGLATRFSALGLLFMTTVIEVFVYPDAYPTHGVWATVLLIILAKGAGPLSLDYWVSKRFGRLKVAV